MSVLKALSGDQIEKFASRKGVKRIPVENFLASLNGSSVSDALMNVRNDARSYKWNAATEKAIRDGITLASK